MEEIKDPYVSKNYFIDSKGVEHEIFPMLIKDRERVGQLLSKIDYVNLFLNLPSPKYDSIGNIILDKKGNPVMDNTACKAMMELFSLALHMSVEEVEEIVDLDNGATIMEHFLKSSNYKKKMEAQLLIQLAGTEYMQELSKIQV